jgi:O-antigen/teichoic acid export membrane protein
MYLDHVTDSMLKGIGEHVFSMWVNITDSLLSVGLVWLFIPRLGISGYAIVIVVMEGYNFVLSALRLYKRVRFRIDLVSSFLMPLGAAVLSAFISKSLFRFVGSGEVGVWIAMKILFATSSFVFFSTVFRAVKYKKAEHPKSV